MVLQYILLGFFGFFWVFLGFFGFFWVQLGFFGFFWVLKFYTILSFFIKESLLFTSKNNFYTPCRVCGGLGAQPPVGVGGRSPPAQDHQSFDEAGAARYKIMYLMMVLQYFLLGFFGHTKWFYNLSFSITSLFYFRFAINNYLKSKNIIIFSNHIKISFNVNFIRSHQVCTRDGFT